MYLALYGDALASKRVVRLQSLVDCCAVNAFLHGDTLFSEECFTLVLVDIHTLPRHSPSFNDTHRDYDSRRREALKRRNATRLMWMS